MARYSKQTACFGCAESKRRCDRTLPSCSRCGIRDTPCVYPQPLRLRTQNFSPNGPDSTVINLERRDAQASSGLESQHQSETVLEGDTRSDAPMDFTTSTELAPAWPSSPSSGIGGSHTTRQPLSWFLQPSAWNVAYHYQAPTTMPPGRVFSNFIRGLQSWLSRFLRTGHNPFIHSHLYSLDSLPQCMKDAYSAISISQDVTHGNEHIVNDIASTHISVLLASQPDDAVPSFPLLPTRDHLARTQALLIHLLLALFSPSIPRRARAESLIGTLLCWANQLWDSATQDASTTMLVSGLLPLSHNDSDDTPDLVAHLHQKFVLLESVRRTWLLCNIATGVYYSYKGDWTSTCAGDICITTRAELWDATSPGRWEAVVRRNDPLFLYSLHGRSLITRKVGASEVDEFARHLFTAMWGIDKVEDWVVRTGDSVSIIY